MANNGPFYPAGRYLCEIVDQGLTKASTGTVQIALKIKVLECTQPAGPVEQQYERTVFMPVTEKTMPYLIPKLQALGYTRDSLKYLNLQDPNCHDLRGTEAEFFCQHKNDQNGELRERWDVAAHVSAPLELKPLDAKEMRQLDMLFGRELKNSGAKPLTSKPRSAAAAPAAAEDDDLVPF